MEVRTSEEGLERSGTELDADDWAEMTAADLRDSFGRFLKLHCVAGATSPSVLPQRLPSAFDTMRAAQLTTQQKESAQ